MKSRLTGAAVIVVLLHMVDAHNQQLQVQDPFPIGSGEPKRSPSYMPSFEEQTEPSMRLGEQHPVTAAHVLWSKRDTPKRASYWWDTPFQPKGNANVLIKPMVPMDIRNRWNKPFKPKKNMNMLIKPMVPIDIRNRWDKPFKPKEKANILFQPTAPMDTRNWWDGHIQSQHFGSRWAWPIYRYPVERLPDQSFQPRKPGKWWQETSPSPMSLGIFRGKTFPSNDSNKWRDNLLPNKYPNKPPRTPCQRPYCGKCTKQLIGVSVGI